MHGRPLTEDQYKDAPVAEARERRSVTVRATSAALEEIMYEPFPILDSGFVRVIDYMGDDNAVVQAARVSYGKGTKQVSDDRGLIRYLMRHRHTTPFELASIKLHVKAPIFVTRQWFRHRTASINEYSARYSVLDREFYVPDMGDVGLQSLDNRQGSGASADGALAATVIERLKEDSSRAYESYLWMLNEDGNGDEVEPGRGRIARELARTTLPVSIYTQFYWQVNLWNLLNFLNLRASPGAQHEIRLYARRHLGGGRPVGADRARGLQRLRHAGGVAVLPAARLGAGRARVGWPGRCVELPGQRAGSAGADQHHPGDLQPLEEGVSWGAKDPSGVAATRSLRADGVRELP